MLMFLLNTAMLTGHSSTESVLSFPKNDIRDLKDQVTMEADTIAAQVNSIKNVNDTNRASWFDSNYTRFNSSLSSAYALKGVSAHADVTRLNVTTVNVTYGSGTDTKIDLIVLNVSYYDSNTRYMENFTLKYS